MNSVNLSLGRRYFNLAVRIQSRLFSQILFEAMCLRLKSFTQSAVGWVSTNPSVYACIASTNEQVLSPTKANDFLRSQKIYVSVSSGLPQTTAGMFLWSLRESIDPRLQHLGVNLQCCFCAPEIRQRDQG